MDTPTSNIDHDVAVATEIEVKPAIQAEIPVSFPIKFKVSDVLRHLKGGVYTIVGLPTEFVLEHSREPAYAYRMADGRVCVRGQSEMEDGRFQLASHITELGPHRFQFDQLLECIASNKLMRVLATPLLDESLPTHLREGYILQPMHGPQPRPAIRFTTEEIEEGGRWVPLWNPEYYPSDVVLAANYGRRGRK